MKFWTIQRLIFPNIRVTGTFVWWETQIDPTLHFGIPMGGWKPVGKPFLENNQMEPDIKVSNAPAVMAKRRDQQLEEAVKALIKLIQQT